MAVARLLLVVMMLVLLFPSDRQPAALYLDIDVLPGKTRYLELAKYLVTSLVNVHRRDPAGLAVLIAPTSVLEQPIHLPADLEQAFDRNHGPSVPQAR